MSFTSHVMYQDLDGMVAHLETLLEKTDVFHFYCEDPDHNFATSCFEWEKTKDKYDMTLYYRVFHCDYDTSMSYEFTGIENARQMVDAVFHAIFDLRLCKECFYLTDHPDQFCQKCLSHKIRDEYARKYRQSLPTIECAICLEQVYSPRLSCGHYFHKTCFVKQNRGSWFCEDTTPDIRCPMCREHLTESDKSDFFLC